MKITDAARLLYVDLVRGRTSIRIDSASERAGVDSPIFLLGIYRSGTTLLRYVIDSHPDIACPPETDFIDKLRFLLDDERALRGLASMGFNETHVRARLAMFVEYFFGNYAAAHGKSRWADKSPSYLDCIDLLTMLFPKARFVTIHRHPLDQVHSHTKGGSFIHEPIQALLVAGEDTRITAARYWICKTQLLMERDHDERFLSIRYEDLCSNPTRVTELIAGHVGIGWSPLMLRFGEQSHDFGAEATRTRVTKDFHLSTGHWQAWDPDVVQQAWEITAPLARRLGYEPRPC